MNPADLDTVKQAVSHQGALLGQHGAALQDIMNTLQSLATNISGLQDQLASFSASPAPVSLPEPVAVRPAIDSVREPWVPTPERYEGSFGKCRSFLMQCGLVFEQQPRSYATDRAKVAFVTGLLGGKALEWATAVWESGEGIAFSYSDFTAALRKLFDLPVCGKDAARRLSSLQQGERSVAEYVIEFRTLAAESRWNDESLEAAYYKGLCEQMKDELISYPESAGLEELISLSVRVDNRRLERGRERKQRMPNLPPTPRQRRDHGEAVSSGVPVVRVSRREVFPESEPMQMGRQHLSEQERQRRKRTGSCLYCGHPNHYLASCPLRPGNYRAR